MSCCSAHERGGMRGRTQSHRAGGLVTALVATGCCWWSDLSFSFGTLPAGSLRPATRPGVARKGVEAEDLIGGDVLLELPLQGEGFLQVARHAVADNSTEEWRTLRFGGSQAIQSVVRVLADAGEAGGVALIWRDLPLAYAKSLTAAVLTALDAVGAPVLAELHGDPEHAKIRILCIGLGGGSVPSFLARSLPHSVITVAELEPSVLRAAEDCMGFVQSPRLQVVVEDGAAFAERVASSGAYDAVVVDAYGPDSVMPSALASPSQGFVRSLRQGLLKPSGGVVVVNCMPGTDPEAVLSTYKDAVQQASTACRCYHIRLDPEEPADEAGDLDDMFSELDELFGENEVCNRIGVLLAGPLSGAMSMPLASLAQRLQDAGQEASSEVRCDFDMGELAVRGIRELL